MLNNLMLQHCIPPPRPLLLSILGDTWRPQTAKEAEDKISITFCVLHGRNVLSALPLGVSIRSRNGAPSVKECVVIG